MANCLGKYLMLLIANIATIFLTYGQVEDLVCTTSSKPSDTTYMFHYGNNTIFDQLDSVLAHHKNKNSAGRSDVTFIEDNFTFHIPIKVWVYNDDDGFHQAILWT